MCSHFFAKQGVVPTSEGCIPTSEGVILTSEGVILTKQAIFRPFFARTNTRNPENRDKTPGLAIEMPCFCNIFRFHSYPTDMSTHREVLWCIGIMDFAPKSRVWGLDVQMGYCEQACDFRSFRIDSPSGLALVGRPTIPAAPYVRTPHASTYYFLNKRRDQRVR
jgi:hypothetical protein